MISTDEIRQPLRCCNTLTPHWAPILWQDHLPSKPSHDQRKMLSIEGAMEVESWTSDNSLHDKSTKKEDEFARVQWPLWDAKVKHKFMAEQNLPASPALQTIGEPLIDLAISCWTEASVTSMLCTC